MNIESGSSPDELSGSQPQHERREEIIRQDNIEQVVLFPQLSSERGAISEILSSKIMEYWNEYQQKGGEIYWDTVPWKKQKNSHSKSGLPQIDYRLEIAVAMDQILDDARVERLKKLITDEKIIDERKKSGRAVDKDIYISETDVRARFPKGKKIDENEFQAAWNDVMSSIQDQAQTVEAQLISLPSDKQEREDASGRFVDLAERSYDDIHVHRPRDASDEIKNDKLNARYINAYYRLKMFEILTTNEARKGYENVNVFDVRRLIQAEQGNIDDELLHNAWSEFESCINGTLDDNSPEYKNENNPFSILSIIKRITGTRSQPMEGFGSNFYAGEVRELQISDEKKEKREAILRFREFVTEHRADRESDTMSEHENVFRKPHKWYEMSDEWQYNVYCEIIAEVLMQREGIGPVVNRDIISDLEEFGCIVNLTQFHKAWNDVAISSEHVENKVLAHDEADKEMGNREAQESDERHLQEFINNGDTKYIRTYGQIAKDFEKSIGRPSTRIVNEGEVFGRPLRSEEASELDINIFDLNEKGRSETAQKLGGKLLEYIERFEAEVTLISDGSQPEHDEAQITLEDSYEKLLIVWEALTSIMTKDKIQFKNVAQEIHETRDQRVNPLTFKKRSGIIKAYIEGSGRLEDGKVVSGGTGFGKIRADILTNPEIANRIKERVEAAKGFMIQYSQKENSDQK